MGWVGFQEVELEGRPFQEEGHAVWENQVLKELKRE